MTTQTTSAWDVFFNDKRYKDLLDELNAFLKESEQLFKAGYRLEVINGKQSEKIPTLQDKFKELAQKMLDERNQKMVDIEKTHKTEENPNQEVIRRQDFIARLKLLSNHEVVDLINILDSKEVSVFEINELQSVIENRFSENERNYIPVKFSELKIQALFPYSNDEEYQKYSYEYDGIENTGMAISGVPVTQDEYGIVYKSVADRYNDIIKAQSK